MARLGRLVFMLGLVVNSVQATTTTSKADSQRRSLQKCSAACPMSGHQEETPTPPKEDSWYTQTPENLENTTPGTILRVRQAPGNLTSIVPGSAAAYNIMYRTTDSQYKPAYAVTTLFVPSCSIGTNTTSTPILLSYQYPYDAVDLNLSPSYAMYSSMPVEDISSGLSRGWYVLSGDYEGPLASFSAGVMSGHAVLDGVRAVLSGDCAQLFSPSSSGLWNRELSLTSWRYALWGYSGGAVASELAAELQVQYAPELQFAGVAVGGLTPNISTIRDLVEGTLYAGLTPSWLIGVTSQYPEAREYLISVLNKAGPYNVTTFMGLAQSTTTLITFAFEQISDYFINGFSDLETPIINKIITSDNTMGYHGVPQMPIFAYKAIHDELSAVADTDKLIDRYCELPAVDIFYQRNEVGGHGDESTSGSPRARAWLVEVLEGTYAETGCRIETIVDVAV